jgi:hypothetical protein
MESYDPDHSVFSNSNLSEISNTIRAISAPNEKDSIGGVSPSGETPGETRSEANSETLGIPGGQLVRPLFDSPGVSPSISSDNSSGRLPDVSPRVSPLGEIIILTPNQALLYECSKLLNGHFTTLARISQTVNISVDTLRSGLRKLRKSAVVSWSVENISGQNGMRISAVEVPYAVRGSRDILDEKLASLDHTKLALNSNLEPTSHQIDHQVIHQVNHQVSHQISYSSSNKNIKLLQDLQRNLLLEEHFQDLDLRSLEPYLDQFETTDSLQLFFDMANASITAAQDSTKPIQNPKGFLFAQLRAGFINPPPGFKSRRVKAQEAMNAQLQTELDELRRLQAQEAELRFELFKAGLSNEQRTQLEEEAGKRVKPGAAVSRERQLDVYRDEVLREWFGQ